jgi:putative ABC transport system substrate-binding protein
MHKLAVMAAAVLCFGVSLPAQAQATLKRIGVIHPGGASFEAAVQGMVTGLKQYGLVEGKHFILHVRDTRAGSPAIETAAKQLVSERVDVLFTVSTSVTIAAKNATRDIPIVFYVGGDPVRFGLVKSYAQPGDRLTGVQQRSVDLVAKRMDILKQILPSARRVVVFYNPQSGPVTVQSVANARDAARKLDVELVERPVGSVEEVVNLARGLHSGDADACFQVNDAMLFRAIPQIIAVMRERKLPFSGNNLSFIQEGALVAYGVNYFEVGQFAAKHMQRVLAGARPQDLPVETYDKVQLGLNLRVAQELGITVPQPIILRADQVIR